MRRGRCVAKGAPNLTRADEIGTPVGVTIPHQHVARLCCKRYRPCWFLPEPRRTEQCRRRRRRRPRGPRLGRPSTILAPTLPPPLVVTFPVLLRCRVPRLLPQPRGGAVLSFVHETQRRAGARRQPWALRHGRQQGRRRHQGGVLRAALCYHGRRSAEGLFL